MTLDAWKEKKVNHLCLKTLNRKPYFEQVYEREAEMSSAPRYVFLYEDGVQAGKLKQEAGKMQAALKDEAAMEVGPH